MDRSKRCSCGHGCDTFGACMRRKNLRVGYCRTAAGWDKTRQNRWDRELDAYRDVRRQGIQPDGTSMAQIEKAKRLSDVSGVAYGQ